jgi:hypothetical protein
MATRASASDSPPALWGEPLAPYSLENVGSKALHVISVELKATGLGQNETP